MIRKAICRMLIPALILSPFGCSGNQPRSTAEPAVTDMPVTIFETSVPESTVPVASSLLSEPVIIDSDTDLVSQCYSLDLSVLRCLDIENGARVNASSITIDQVNAGSPLGNASLVFLSEGTQLNMNSSAVTGSGADTDLIYAGKSSSAVLTDCGLADTGDNSSCATAEKGGNIVVDTCTFVTEGSAVCLHAGTSGSIECKSATLSGGLSLTDNGIISMTDCSCSGDILFFGPDNVLTLHNTSVSGTISPFGDDVSDIMIRLTDGSRFTGSTVENTGTGISISMDATSSWELTSDAYLQGFSVESGNVTGIKSNGFTIYYNSEHEDCAWLSGKTISLPGNGTLSPLI